MNGPAAPVLLAVLVALVVSLASPFAWLPLLRRLGAVDLPSERSSHAVPTARGVGLGPASGLLVAGTAVVAAGAGTATTLVVLAVALAAALLGLVLSDPDRRIAERNLERDRVDLGYLSTLSADAVPVLPRAALAGQRSRLGPDGPFGFSIARQRARDALAR